MRKQIFVFIMLSFIVFTMSIAVFADQIELQNGQKLRGEVQNDSLLLRTDYAELNIQLRYINKLNKESGGFVIRASENNRFSGQLLTDIVFIVNGEERTFSGSEIVSVDFSDTDSFNDNQGISVSLRNGDFFFASTVDNSIAINTSLGSPLNVNYANIVSIEYIAGEDIYLVKRNNSSDIRSDLSGKKIIVWPAAGEIFELEFDYVKKIDFN